MTSTRYDPPVAGKAIDAEAHRRFALEIRESRESLISTLRALPLVCRRHVLTGEISRRRFLPYERLESLFDRLREFHSGHEEPDVSRFLDQARRSRGQMNRAREALILANLGIVPHVVRKLRPGNVPFGDLVQDGYIGLLKAVDRFDPDRGASFSTYACWWIRKALNDAYSSQARSIHVPAHVRRDLGRVRQTTHELETELERVPLDDEIANRTGLSVRKIQRLRRVPPDPSALEDIAENRDGGWNSVVAGIGSPDPFELTLKGELHQQATIALEQLSPRERSIVKLRFGFQGGNGMTLQQIADRIGVSRERVRQIECAAMDKISRWAKRAHVANC